MERSKALRQESSHSIGVSFNNIWCDWNIVKLLGELKCMAKNHKNCPKFCWTESPSAMNHVQNVRKQLVYDPDAIKPAVYDEIVYSL